MCGFSSPGSLSHISASGLALQRLQINKAPVGGSCSAEVLDNKEEEEEMERLVQRAARLVVSALVDTVLCNCTGWEDPEGFEIPKYSFFGGSARHFSCVCVCEYLFMFLHRNLYVILV